MPSRLLLVAFALLAAAPLSPSAAQRRINSDVDLRDANDPIRRRSADLEHLRRDAARPTPKAEKNAAEKFPQIKEDFERIQIINGDVLQSARTDYARVAEAAAEVHRRAARLDSNLFSPDTDKKPKGDGAPGGGPPDLKALLSALDGALARFVKSPLFRNTMIINPQDYDRARQDLREVIKLSTRIEKEAARLKKAGGG